MAVEVKLFESLEDVAREADGALDRARQPSIYDRLSWFEMTSRHCGRGRPPLVARAANGHGAAWLFLCRTGPGQAEALASWYTLDFDVVRDGAAEDRPLIEAIAREMTEIGRITLSPVAEPKPIVDGFRAAGWKCFCTPATSNWYALPPADFTAYWEGRPGRLRNTVKRRSKRAGLDIEIHRCFDEAAWEAYRTVYGRSWKPDEGSWEFMRAFAEAEGEAGALRLGIAYKDGEPVAAQLWHVEYGRATIHKLAYSESAKGLSPGSILSEAMFRHVLEEDKPEIVDYGSGDEAYKADWMDAARPLYRIELYNPRRPAAWPALFRRTLSGLVRRGPSD